MDNAFLFDDISKRIHPPILSTCTDDVGSVAEPESYTTTFILHLYFDTLFPTHITIYTCPYIGYIPIYIHPRIHITRHVGLPYARQHLLRCGGCGLGVVSPEATLPTKSVERTPFAAPKLLFGLAHINGESARKTTPKRSTADVHALPQRILPNGRRPLLRPMAPRSPLDGHFQRRNVESSH